MTADVGSRFRLSMAMRRSVNFPEKNRAHPATPIWAKLLLWLRVGRGLDFELVEFVHEFIDPFLQL